MIEREHEALPLRAAQIAPPADRYDHVLDSQRSYMRHRGKRWHVATGGPASDGSSYYHRRSRAVETKVA